MSEPAFFVTGGTLRQDAQSYVARKADAELLDLLRAGEFCYVLTSRQMGKSSLMVRAAMQLREEGVSIVVLDLTRVGQNLEVEQWYFSMLTHVGEQLRIEDELEAYWDGHAREAPLDRFMGALREVYLERKRKPLVIFVDEIDYVRSLQKFSADEFFAGIRECYNRRTQDQKLCRLTFCLLGVATPSDLIRDQRMTPFNIGRGIELQDFKPADAAVLADGLSPHRETAHLLLERVLSWTSGHPYLTQKLCAEVAKASAYTAVAVDAVCAEIFLSAQARERDDNLHFVRERLLNSAIDRAALLDAYAKVRRGERLADDQLNPVLNELRLSGVVVVADGFLQIRNRIYARVFDLQWARDNLPNAERRRQRDAFHRGVRRVAGYSLAVVAAMGALALYALKQKHRAFDALAEKSAALVQAADAAQLAETQANLAEIQAKKADFQKEEADARARETIAMREQIAANFLENQRRVGKLLDAAGPLLGTKSQARQLFLEAARALDAGASPEAALPPEVRFGRAGLLRTYSQLYLKLGVQKTAIEQARDALGIVVELVQKYPADAQYKRRLVECHNTLGDAVFGDRDQASLGTKDPSELRHAIESYELAQQIAVVESKAHPEDREWTRMALATYNNIGDVQTQLDNYPDALKAFRAARSLIEELSLRNSGDPELRENVAMNHDRLGDALLFQRQVGEARQEFEEGFRVREALQAEAPDDPNRKSGLALSYNKLGKASLAEAKWDQALAAFEQSLRLRKELAERDPKNPAWQRDLAITYNNIARAWADKGNDEEAIRNCQERVRISRNLFREDEANADWRLGVCYGLDRLADALLSAKITNPARLAEALESSAEAVRLTGRHDPRFLFTLARAQRASRKVDDGLETIEEALGLLPAEDQRSNEQRDLARMLQGEQARLAKAKAEHLPADPVVQKPKRPR